jgi:hypothetical protein
MASGGLYILDQENVSSKIEWKSGDNCGRLFFLYRPAKEGTDSTDGDKFLNVHQVNLQRRLLKFYDNTVSLLDATYRNTK